jgi:hypothetical protein
MTNGEAWTGSAEKTPEKVMDGPQRGGNGAELAASEPVQDVAIRSVRGTAGWLAENPDSHYNGNREVQEEP